MEKTRIALIGLGHVHAQTLYDTFFSHPDEVEWLGMADAPGIDPAQTQKHIELNAAEVKGLPLYDDYRALLEKKPDLVLCGSSVADHVPIALASLEAGASVILEKPMAVTYEDAAAMVEAHRQSRGELIVNWPSAWQSALRKVRELAEQGAVGRIVRLQYMASATLGPYSKKDMSPEELKKLWWYQRDKGGGSIMDYAGYGTALATWIFGEKQARTVYGVKKSVFTDFSDVEDYSVFIADYGDCTALMEGTWSTVSTGQIPTGPILYGEKGTIVCDYYSAEVKVYRSYRPYQPCLPPDEVYHAAPLGEDLGSHVLDHLRRGTPLFAMLTADFNLRAAAVLDAGRRSCETGLAEKVK